MLKPSNPPELREHQGMKLVGLRRHHAFASAQATIPQQWDELNAASRPWNKLDASVSYGAVCGVTADSMEYLCGHAVASFDGIGPDWGRMIVPPQRYAVFVHEGPIVGIQQSWERAMAWLQASQEWEDGHTPPFERYDQRYDVTMASGAAEIWLPVRPRRA